MSEKKLGLPKAKVEKSYLTWVLWLVPVGAVGICIYFVLHDVVFAGPTITIYFNDAAGLQEKNSMVKYRGMKVGEIESLKLTGDSQRVVVKAKLDASAKNLARQGSIFWVVQPQLKVGSISGLRTIVSGDYVTVQPGSGPPTNIFFGSDEAPLTPEPSFYITLLSDTLDSVERESQIFYRGIQVGEVTDFRLADDAQHVIIQARIRDEYAPLVRVDSKFWNAGGINVHAGIFSGLQISAESAQTVVSGGIAFVTPENYGAQATNGAVFVLADKEDDTWKNWNPAIPLKSPEGEKNKNTLPQVNPK